MSFLIDSTLISIRLLEKYLNLIFFNIFILKISKLTLILK